MIGDVVIGFAIALAIPFTLIWGLESLYLGVHRLYRALGGRGWEKP